MDRSAIRMAIVDIPSKLRWSTSRRLVPFLAAASLLACVAVGVLWWRAQSGRDEAMWRYDRYLANGSAASNTCCVSSDKRRLSLSASWGHVGPFNGQLVYGYYLNADQSGGRPRFTFRHEVYDFTWRIPKVHTEQNSLPIQWQFSRRTKAANGDDFCSLDCSISHWLLALVLLAPLLLCFGRLWAARRNARATRARRELPSDEAGSDVTEAAAAP